MTTAVREAKALLAQLLSAVRLVKWTTPKKQSCRYISRLSPPPRRSRSHWGAIQ